MAYLLLTLTTLFWSGNFVLSRAMHAEIPPLALSFWRWLTALCILLPFALPALRRQLPALRRHWRFVLLQGVLGVTGFNTLLYLAMQTTTVINAVLVNSCIPVLIAVVSWLLYRETMHRRQVAGVLVSLSGVALIMAHGRLETLLAMDFNRGDLLMLGAAVVWALYSANLRRFPQGLDPRVYQVAIMVVGLTGILPLYLAELGTGRRFAVDAAALLTIAYVALFASVLAFLFWNRAVREVGANRAGPFVHLMPVFSTLMAAVFLGEVFSPYHGFGIALVFGGIALATLFRGRQ